MKLDLKEIPQQSLAFIGRLKKYGVFIFIVVVLLAYSYIVLQVQQTINVEPTEAQVSEKLQGLQSTKLDQDAIKKIEDLESTSIEVRALFQEARDNPFQE